MYRSARGRGRRRRRRRSRLPLYAFLLAVLSFTLAFTLPPEEKEQQPDRIAAVKPVGSLLELSPDPAPDAPGESAWNLILANPQPPCRRTIPRRQERDHRHHLRALALPLRGRRGRQGHHGRRALPGGVFVRLTPKKTGSAAHGAGLFLFNQSQTAQTSSRITASQGWSRPSKPSRW